MCTCSADTPSCTTRVRGNPPIPRLLRAAPIDFPNIPACPMEIFDHSEIYTFRTCLIYYYVSPVDIYTLKARNPAGFVLFLFFIFFSFPGSATAVARGNFCANRKKKKKYPPETIFDIPPCNRRCHRRVTGERALWRPPGPDKYSTGIPEAESVLPCIVFYIYINYIVFFGNDSPGHKSRARPSSDLVSAIYNNSFAIHIPRSADLFPTHRKTRI